MLESLIGAGISGIGGLISNLTSQGARDAEAKAKQAALNRILGVYTPTAKDLEVNFEKQHVVGEVNPELQGTITQGPSAYEGIDVNPELRDAQMNALSQLEQLGNTGLTASDRAALMQIQNQTSGQAQAVNKSALSQAAQRGMAGGGAELAARLIGGQGAANAGAQAGLNVAAQAQQKALQAMSNAGALGSQMEGQQFGEDAQKAAAADAISRFNTANRQSVIGSNVGEKNKAQYANLNNEQSVANANAAIANEQAERNAQAQAQASQMALSKATAAVGPSNTVAGQFGQSATDNSNMWSGIGNAANGILTAYGNSRAAPATDQPQANVNQGTNTQMGSDQDWANYTGAPSATTTTKINPDAGENEWNKL